MRIAIISGGPVAEAEVSRVSAAAVVSALASRGHDVAEWECDGALPGALAAHRPDVVFPVVHGAFGEDGCLQGLLELLGLPYVGSGVLASALANDKPTAKSLYRAAGLPVIADVLVRGSSNLDEAAEHVVSTLGARVVVKPAAQGSGLGVTLLRTTPASPSEAVAAVRNALQTALSLGETALVERFVEGLEVTCGVLQRHGEKPFAFAPTEIESLTADWYDFHARYGKGGSRHHCPARLTPSVLARVQAIAVAAHEALGCRDLSRSDFVVTHATSSAEVFLLETNTMPGMTATSLYPEAAAQAGIAFAELCDTFVRDACKRGVTVRYKPAAFPS
jgi:D-alanine-D-alanine ligase